MNSKTTIYAPPPANTVRNSRWRDFPNTVSPAQYRITDETGKAHTVTVSKNKRRVLEGLMRAPMYCASPVRISDLVHILKRDYGVDIAMDLYANDNETDRAKFGIYTLKSKVELANGNGGTY
ncbi:hypothetical protein [Sulfitobacter dubius]|uniref:hypothetical protein n=1 Tax=Sulfitobacter dubius TaxID=218673 RepID=UPI0008EBD43F|nr:hypothetical protein [Sulfitobacter dubius]SFG68929.1 hypothetical protein SAMN04488039_1011675 [Sulfitobacter dubius]